MQEKILFNVKTPLGFSVRVKVDYWNFIVTTKHPVMKGKESIVKEVLKNPDEVRLSKNDNKVHLFYKKIKTKRWICAVTKRLNEEGFLITCYPTDNIKEGEALWKK